MNVTREVVIDLLPVYFSGEASADTRLLVEDYFRGQPEFERIARGAATPFDTLRSAPLTASAEREKRDLQEVRTEVRRRKWWFGMALFFTIAPLSFLFSGGHIVWMMVRDNPWDAAVYWSAAAFCWLLYGMRMRRRTALLAGAIFLSLFAVSFVLHLLYINGPWASNRAELEIACIGAALCWAAYLRSRTQR